ncbi:MAG: class I tRNA ligase family protein, partial [Pseudomonadota bacterium]
MVLHATYKDKNGKFIYPEDAKNNDGVVIGRSEKMSKSKKNTVSPSEIIIKYGADTARLFMLSDSPPEKDLEWTDNGVEGAYKFLNRLWRFVHEFIEINPGNEANNDKTRGQIHKLLKQITESYNNLSLNLVVAGIREMSNTIFAIPRTSDNYNIIKESTTILLQSLYPAAPHIASELWKKMGNKESIDDNWPQFDSEAITESEITIAVQVSGKLRATIEVDKNISKEELTEIVTGLPNIKKFIEGKEIKKIIIVPGKIINIVCI